MEVHDSREWYYTMVDNAIIDNEEISTYAKVVYLVLCRHANINTKECYPSYMGLKKKAGISNSPLSNALTELEEAGYIKRTHRPNKSTLYQIIGSPREREPNASGSLRDGIPPDGEELDKESLINKNQGYIYSSSVQVIFDHWNRQKIIQHRKLTDKIKRAINSALKDYTQDEITMAVTNYKLITESDKYFFSYRWTLREFLQRGLDKFLDWEICSRNYRNKDDPKKSSNVANALRLAEKYQQEEEVAGGSVFDLD